MISIESYVPPSVKYFIKFCYTKKVIHFIEKVFFFCFNIKENELLLNCLTSVFLNYLNFLDSFW